MPRPNQDLCEIHSLGPTTREWLVSARQVKAFAISRTKFVGYSEAGAGYRFVRHAPTFGQILACTGGEGRVLVDGRWQRCSADYAYVTAPRAPSAYEIRPGARWRVCWVIYDEKAQLPGLTAGESPRLVRTETFGLNQAIRGLCHEAAGEAEPAALELWVTLVNRQVLRILQPGDTDPRLANLWVMVRQDLGGDWNLSRMARCAGVSEESLRRLCLKHYDQPPLTHVTQLRMLFAADLLTCTQEKIASIAERTGYADPFAFSNAFKRVLGQPPSRYRARHE